LFAAEEKISAGRPRKKREPKKQFRIDFSQTTEEEQFSKSKVRIRLMQEDYSLIKYDEI